MFMGEYGHSLDPKGRLIFPTMSRNRDSLCASFCPVPTKWSLISRAVS